MYSSLTNPNVSFNASKRMDMTPRISMHLSIAKRTPNSLLIHPKVASLTSASMALPRSMRPTMTATSIMTKAMSLRVCSEMVMYWDSQPPKRSANVADAHTPMMIDMIETNWAMKPFLMPCITAGTRHIKIMMSNMFINPPKICIFAD